MAALPGVVGLRRWDGYPVLGLPSRMGRLVRDPALQRLADARQGAESMVAGGPRQLGQGADAETLLDQTSAGWADARDLQQLRCLGRDLALQLLLVAGAARLQVLGHLLGDRRPN